MKLTKKDQIKALTHSYKINESELKELKKLLALSQAACRFNCSNIEELIEEKIEIRTTTSENLEKRLLELGVDINEI